MLRFTRLKTAGQWSNIDKCTLWLGVWLVVYIPYLGRITYLLRHPEVEPYFDRGALAVYRQSLIVIIIASSILLVSAWALRQRPQHRWLPHAANQITFVWLMASAYVIGPFTNPILGLLIAASFVSALLFERSVVVAALVSALSLLVLTTVAERLEILPYAPLFARPLDAAGRLSDAYVIGTGIASIMIVALSSALAIYLVGQRRVRERELMLAGEARQKVHTELQQALESLRDSEECFRQLAENTREVFWMLDAASGRLLYLSPAFDRLWGIPGRALHERLDAFLKIVHPDDLDRVADRLSHFRELATNAVERELEYRIVRPDGDLRWIAVRAFPIRDSEGKVYRIGGLLEDISERKATEATLREAHVGLERRVAQRTAELLESNEHLKREAAERARAEQALRDSEEQLREQFAELDQLYRTAPIGLALHDASLRFVRINERLAAINGHPVEAHIGRSIRDLIPDIGKMVSPILNGVLESGEPALDIEIHGTTPAEPDVQRRWMTSYYPLKAADGRVLGVSAIVQDISERAWAEERARQHLEDLAHVSRLSTMGEMAAGIAHELNQPLAAMANFAFVGLRTLDGEQSPRAEALRGLFTELSDQALRAGDIIQHLRAFIRKTHSPRAVVSINALIGDVLRLVDTEMRLNGVRAEIHLDASIDSVEADAIQVQQVVLNLLRNALEAMEPTAPDSRRLAITSSQRDDGSIEVSVADSGHGLSAKDSERLFAAFFTTKPAGMGMGLAISRSIIEDHGGRLWAEPLADHGAVFRFTLPSAKEDRERAS